MIISIGQPSRTFLTLVCVLLAVLGSAGSLQAQDKPGQLTETLTLSPQQLFDLNQIAALRARQGGGLSEQLKGVPGIDPEQQFQKSLKSIASAMEKPRQETDAGNLDFAKMRTSPLQSVFGTDQGNDRPNSGASQQVLRSSARSLEELAAKLEQAKFYELADGLRKTATQYWLQARKLD